MNVYTHIQQVMYEYYGKALQYSKKPYIKEFLMVVATSMVIAGGYLAFGWYQQRQNTHAFAALVEIAKSYETALQKHKELQEKPAAEKSENPWEDTQLLLEALSSAHKGSNLSPFFMMYQADVALHAEANYEKACQLMEKGLHRLPKNSIYYDMFNLKRIKMLLDSPASDVRDKAVLELEKVGYSKSNYYAQEALYTLASYQMYVGNREKAIEAWKALAQQGESDKALIISPWVQQAQETLKTLHITYE